MWKSESESMELCFSTPALADCGNGRTDLVVAVPGELWGFNPDTGKLRWFAQTGIRGNVSPSVVASDDVLFVTGGFPQSGTVAVRGGGKGDVTKTHLLWSSEDASYVPSPVVQGDHLFFVSDRGVATCLEAQTGKVVTKEPLPGITSTGRGGKPVYASTLLIGKHLYAVTRRKGAFVLDAAPQMKVVAQNSFTGDESDFNATPAISNNQLFLRSNKFLYCIKTVN
ncbi:MAG: PQQ-binding-like beta-propeller repeat protein [Kiritimatiellaeota bacterium]|nr:PQQ-binding-like beta-propeller repeat protein [Kiritimatiellota bacterium]